MCHSSKTQTHETMSACKDTSSLDPLQAPPQALKDLYKSWRPHSDPSGRQNCFDLSAASHIYKIPNLQHVLEDFCKESTQDLKTGEEFGKTYSVSEDIPGLMIAPSLLPPAAQVELLSSLLHRSLSDPSHQTNCHLNHDIIYPKCGASFFAEKPSSINFISRDGNEKKNISVERALERKLRWVTLGGQYDWTKKVYPEAEPPAFPSDIAKLIQGIFCDMEPQAAIVNLYSPGDTLGMHRDVSEEVDRGLVSISIGCDAIFILGLQNEVSGETRSCVLRLRSGDAVYMSGEWRFAWHGVPCIIPDTCPKYLEDWPGDDYIKWKGWMKNKRVNLNVRQMRQESSTLRDLGWEIVS